MHRDFTCLALLLCWMAPALCQPSNTSLDQQFDSWRLTPAQAAAIGRPDTAGKVRICFSPYTPYVFCDPNKPSGTPENFSGYLLEVFRSLAQQVPWLSDFDTLYFDCMEWTAMLVDLAADNGTCLLAPTDVSPAEAANYPGVQISWILDKEGLKILIMPGSRNANLWYPLTVFSPPVWALVVVTSVIVGFMLFFVDTNARSLLKDTDDQRSGGRGTASKGNKPNRRRTRSRSVSFFKARPQDAPQSSARANSAAVQKLQHSSVHEDIESGQRHTSNLLKLSCKHQHCTCTSGLARFGTAVLHAVGVRAGDERAAQKHLKANVVNALMTLADVGEPPVVRTLPGRIVLFAYGLLLLILVAIYTASSAAQLTVRMASNINSLQDLKGKPVATWEEYAPRLLTLGVPAISLKWCGQPQQHPHPRHSRPHREACIARCEGKSLSCAACCGSCCLHCLAWSVCGCCLAPTNRETDKDEQIMLDLIRSGQATALVINRAFVDFIASKHCEFAVVGDEFGMTDYGIAFNKRMQEDLIADLNRHIAAFIQQGMSEQLYDLHIKRSAGNCDNRNLASGNQALSQVTLYQVAALWVMLGLSMAVSCCVLMAYWLRLHLRRRAPQVARLLTRSSRLINRSQSPS